MDGRVGSAKVAVSVTVSGSRTTRSASAPGPTRPLPAAPLTKDESRELVYGMPYAEWQQKYQTEASDAKKAAFEVTRPGDH